MLFNKHSETKQRFGIRKLTIGATSVLLSTLFLTVNNGQKVHAATDETVTSADNKSGTEDKTDITENNQTNITNKETTDKIQEATTEEKQTGDVATTSEKADDNAATDKSSETQASEDKVSSDDKTADVAKTEEAAKTTSDQEKSATTEKTEKTNVTTSKVAKPAVNNKLATANEEPVLSQNSKDNSMTLSISDAELSNTEPNNETIKLNATNVNIGDQIIIKVKKGSSYGLKRENLPIGTVKEYDQGDYKVYELNITTSGKFEYKIVANRNNGYLAQSSPMSDTGVTYKDVQWSINGEEQEPLSFKQTIIPQLSADSVYIADSNDGVSNTIKNVEPNKDYNFVYVMKENNGIMQDNNFMAGVINSAVNYGSTITIPVPENFVLNEEASLRANNESDLGGLTITQNGMGSDVIITVPKGKSLQNWNSGRKNYTLTGKFVFDEVPKEDTVVSAKGKSVIEQIYTADGQKISATGNVFKVTIAGSESAKPAHGPISVSASGAQNSNELMMDSNPTNDPQVVNWFGYNNNDVALNDAKIQLDLADGLFVSGIKTPKDLGSSYNNIGNIESYTYEMTLNDGTKVTGVVKAGEIAQASAGKGIRSITFTPNTNQIGQNTKTEDLGYIGNLSDQQKNLSSNLFIAYGHLNSIEVKDDKNGRLKAVYDDGSELKVGAKLVSSITVYGSNFKNGNDGNPIVSYTAGVTQKIIDSSSLKASVSAAGYQGSTNPGDRNAGALSLNPGGDGNTNTIYEPIFYYVIPENAIFAGNTIDDVSKLQYDQKTGTKPKLTTYFVNGRQIVKIDYTGTKYNFNTKASQNTILTLDNVNNQTTKDSTWEIYIYSKDTNISTSAKNSNPVLTASNADPSQELDAGKFYYLGGGSWNTNTASAVVMGDVAHGNQNAAGIYVQQAVSDDKGSEDMSFKINAVNYDHELDLRDAVGFINLPVNGYNNTTLDFQLTGPAIVEDGTVLYSTTTTNLPTGVGTATPSTDSFLTQEQVEAKIASGEMSWSDIKSIAVKYDVIKANSATKPIIINGKDANITYDAGKQAQLQWGLYGGNDMPPLVKNDGSKIVVSGSSTVNTRLHYTDVDGNEQYIDVPTMSKTYQDNKDTMRDGDFNERNIPKDLIPKGYQIVLKNGKAVKSIIDNGGKTWVTDAKDGSAQFNQKVIYNFDGDTVQFELEAIIDKATQTVTHTVHFVTDGDNPQKLHDDVSVNVSVTELTNEASGKKTYSASYTLNGQTVDVPVTVNSDGQISINLPATAIPNIKNYYVVDSTKDEANALTHTFTFTKDAKEVLENTVKYAPVKQELQIKVYDDEGENPSKALDTAETKVTVDFTGNSGTSFPSDVQTSLEQLKKYYEGKNYEVKILPSGSGQFDNTDNGSDPDKQVQVLEVHLTHAKDVQTEHVKAVRDVTYEGAGGLTPESKSDTFEDAFSRTITTDKVTNKVVISDWTGSHTFDGIDTPAIAGYHPDKKVAGNIEATADSLNAADEATLAKLKEIGVVVSDHVVYAPDHQEVKIRVYDDTTGEELSPVTAQSELKEQGTDVAISAEGLSNEDIPTEFGDNIDLLKAYYESKGYKFVSNTVIPTKYDTTSNGDATTDSNPQYVDIHLEHGLKLEKENKTVTRTINYYDQDKNQLINDANNNVTEPQTVTQTVNFERYAIRDQVTNQIIGYATPDQVIFDDKNEAQLAQKDGYTHTTGEASDARAGYVVTSENSNFASQTNYDLSKYGYEAPTDKDGKSFAQVDEVTPLPTDEDTVINVYYREKVVTVTVDNPPTAGTKVPGTDTEFPPNNWNKDVATNVSTRTIHYIYDKNTFVNGQDVSGKPVPGLNDIEQTVVFTQSAKINLVTGEVIYQGDWKAHNSTTTNQQGETITTDGGSSFAGVVSPSSKTGHPELKGYTPHQEVVNAAEATHGVNAGDIVVRYVGNDSLVQVEYIDEDTGDTLEVDKKTGKSGEKLEYSTTDLIKKYEKQGYELVHDGFTANDGNHNKETFDSYDDIPNGEYPETINQKWTVTLKHKKITVTSNEPKDSTEKITDGDYSHDYPANVGQSDLNNTVSRNISFIYTDKPEGENQAFPPVTQEVSYKRDATIDLVKLAKGDADAVSYTNWEPKEAGKESFDNNPVQVVDGYVADYVVVPSQDVPKDENGKAKNGQDIVVKYSPVGKIIPVDKDGHEIPDAPTPKYNNDPNDPTKTTTTDVPEIPGYHAEVPNVTPDKPGEDTKVVYVKNTQTIDLVYVDTTTGQTLIKQVNVAQGDSGSAIPTSVTDTLNATTQSYLDKGYVIDTTKAEETVPGEFDYSNQNADGSDAEHQVVTVYLKHGTETITSTDPKVPGDPINEKDPNGAKYPKDADKSNLTISSQNIVHYEGAGNDTPKDVVTTDDATLTRTVTIDKVTGEVLETSEWTGKKEYDDVDTPVVNGYYADAKAAGASKVTTDDVSRAKDGVITNETTVTYHPMGKIIPVDKNGNPIPGSETPIFNNDPNDPTKATTTDSPIIPGYHLENPDESTITPNDPGKDRKVVYVADTQNLVVQVFDKDSKTPDQPLDTTKTGATVEFTGESFTNFPTNVATNIDALIKYYEARGYKVETKPTTDEMSAKFDGDKDTTQYLKLVLTHDTETITGENPKTPGTPINPDDPDSPTYGEETSREHLVIKSVDVIEYEGAGDKTPETNTRNNDTTLIRNVTIDKVTGEVITTGEWTGKFTYDPIETPKIDGYTVSLESAGETTIGAGDANEAVDGVITRKVKVVYTPEKQELQLKVYDQDLDKYLGGTDSFYGLTDQEVGEDPQTRLDELKKQFAEWGFDIVEVPELAKNYDNTENGTSDQDHEPQVFVLVVKHHIETVTPDDPKTPEDKIPNTNQNYPSGLTETDLSKTITRTIIVHMPDGSTKEIKQEVVYTRTATVDSVTKEVKYTDWTSKNSNWPEYQSPDVPGYTVDIENVELAKVPVDGHDVTVEINYTADPVPDEPVNPSNPGNPGTTTPDQPQQPGKPTDPTKPSEPTKPGKPGKPGKPSKPGQPTKPDQPTKPAKPVTPTKPDQTHDQNGEVNGKTDLNGFVDGINDEKAGAVAGANDNAQAGAKKLPQTSGESGWQASLLGMGLFFISLFGFKKKKEDE